MWDPLLAVCLGTSWDPCTLPDGLLCVQLAAFPDPEAACVSHG